jgi:hypothetical protein
MPDRGGKAGGRYRANNSGGYGNPPVIHQFKPGSKGGPGRPKGETTLEAAMRKMFGSTVQVSSNGETREVSMVQALAERAKKEFLTGSPRSLELGLELALKYGPEERNDDNVIALALSELTPEERYNLRKIVMPLEYIDRQELRRLQQVDEREKQRRKARKG